MSTLDLYNFSGRVNYAAECIMAGGSRTQTRGFDNCFEMLDGNAVVVALYRRSLKNSRLAANIWSVLTKESVMKRVEKYKILSTRQLKTLSTHIIIAHCRRMAAQYPGEKYEAMAAEGEKLLKDLCEIPTWVINGLKE